MKLAKWYVWKFDDEYNFTKVKAFNSSLLSDIYYYLASGNKLRTGFGAHYLGRSLLIQNSTLDEDTE